MHSLNLLAKLMVLPTLFTTYKLSRPATSHAPNGQVHNQIDFILTPNALSPASTKQTQGPSKVPTLAAIMTSYRIMNREDRRKMKAAKEEWIEKQYKNVE